MSSRNKKPSVIFFLILLFSVMFLWACETTDQGDLPFQPPEDTTSAEQVPESLELQIGGQLFELELALDDKQRAAGLMGREEIDPSGGMLFVMPPVEPFPAELTFWMKDCLVPIDLIFLSTEGEITATHEMQPPEPGLSDEELLRYSSNSPAQYAIELRGGTVKDLNLQVGDTIELPFDYLLELAR